MSETFSFGNLEPVNFAALNGLSQCTIVFIVDVSGSMRGARIDAVNSALGTIAREISERAPAAGLSALHVLTFSSRAEWLSQPLRLDRPLITDVGGATNYGAAFAALNNAGFLSADFGKGRKIFLMMTADGKPSDPGLYGDELRALEGQSWFREAVRTAAAIEDDECIGALTEFTGNRDSVVRVEGDEIAENILKQFLKQFAHSNNAAALRQGNSEIPVSPPVRENRKIDWERDFNY